MHHSELGGLSGLELEQLQFGGQAGGLPAYSPTQTVVIPCPKKMVGRVIGRDGATIKALQQYSGSSIQVDQRMDPTRVSIAGPPKAVQVASSMVQDIVAGTFKGFAMLRSFATQQAKAPDALSFIAQPMPVYIEGYGFVPPSQFYDPGDSAAPVYQQTLPALAPDPVSVLRAISPGATSGSSGQAPSPQGMSGGVQAASHPLPSHLAVQAQLLGMRASSLLPDLGAAPLYSQPNYLRPFQQPLPQAVPQPAAPVQHAVFAASEALQAAEAGAHAPPAASLPPLSSVASTTRSSQTAEGAPLSVWSQLEALSPDGGPAAGSPLLSPLRTPSRAASPPPAKEGSQSQAESAALLAQLQALSVLGSRALSPQPPASQPQPAGQLPAPGGASGGLPLGWIQLRDPEQRCIYHNTLTGQSQYLPPAGSGAGEAAARGAFTGLGGELPQQLFY